MSFKKLSILSALAFAASGFAGQQAMAADASTFAFTEDYDGALQIKFRGFTSECDNRDAGNNCFGDDTAGPNGVLGGPGDNPAGTIGTLNETTFGFGRVDTIDKDGGGNLWNRFANAQGAELVFFLYGIADLDIQINGPSFDIFNLGCVGGAGCDGKIHMDFYLIDSGDWPGFDGINVASRYASGINGDAGPNNGAETSADFKSLTGLTDLASADLLFALEYAPRDPLGANNPTATLTQTVGATTLPTSGLGDLLADCVAGPACAGVNNVDFNTNGEGPAGLPNINDFFGQFTLADATTTAPAVAAQGWFGDVNDPFRGANAVPTVPAPGILLLFGAGLAGLAASARRKARRG